MIYRPDIDGLRAVAVITIIFFHLGIPGFGGAFTGPEVFFVLSGFLIASRIFDQVEKGKFVFSEFYYRRVRRLFPAYFLMLIVTLILSYMFLLPADLREFAKSFASATLYLSNVQFYRETGYFDTAAHFKPLLHTWSLSVEEQFYLFFPVVVGLLAWMSRRQFFFTFLVLSIASFVAAVIWIEFDKSFAFYMFPLRIWELGLGIMIATGCYNLPKFKATLPREVLAWAGILLILVPMFIYEPSMKFPGLAAVPACVGTWLIIQLDGERMTSAQKLLALKPMVYVGTLSYALYLWHWPLFVIYSYTDTNGTGALEVTAILSFTLVISHLTYRFVETPFRTGAFGFYTTKWSVFGSTAALSAVLMAAGVVIFLQNGMPNRFDARTQAAIAATDLFGDIASDCVLDSASSRLKDIEYCEIGAPFDADHYTLIWGDSHSPTYRFAFQDSLPDADALMVWSGGCPALFDARVDEYVATAATDLACERRNAAVKRLVAEDDRIDSVIILGRWSYYGRGTGTGVDIQNEIKVWPVGSDYDPAADQYTVYMERFERTVEELRGKGLKVFVIEQPPEFPEFNARIFVMNQLTGRLSDDVLAQIGTVGKAALETRQGPMIALLDRLEQDGAITLLRTHERLCDADACSLMMDGAPLYFDNNHMAASMVRRISDIFNPVAMYHNGG
ncbi:acyltransferase family protein [Loktanella sp. Alg231-35]|uniref:acyltransferase family protein n=1 Tax=Loktanella sp. Alg231-35 TaxID=1922220 RepID=UPI00131F2A9C|nr:acyltransferase family protein [Loktanella sp. Alg231-35]